MARVTASARLHFGFLNLSLAHERLYGGLGVSLDGPRVTVRAERADGVECGDHIVSEYARRAVDVLDVPGARVAVEEAFPRHVGLGSGTQFSLATLAAIARAYGRDPMVRGRAPLLGRGGRSGVGVAAFEQGGFILDAGHPTARFTTARPADGDWVVPAVAARHPIPRDWRFLAVVPDVEAGRSGEEEDESMRSVVENAAPSPSDRIAGILARRLLPAVAEGDIERFASAVDEIGRLNGAWYADEQGGVYRPPVGELVASLSESAAVFGAGQSSWGPTVYGITDAAHADAAAEAGRETLDEVGIDGSVFVTRGRNRGAHVSDEHND